MKVIIAGPRDWLDQAGVDTAVAESGFDVTEVVSGGARGADACGERWACDRGLAVTRFVADWRTSGRSAGPVRNKAMADHADALIAIDTGTRGTADMIRRAKAGGLKVFLWRPPS